MVRTLVVLVVTPLVALAAWLALAAHEPRADFVYATAQPRTLDPLKASLLEELQIDRAMFEGLARLNPDTFAPEPAVAERWDVSDDRMTWTFHLRADARWSNGDSVTADDFRFAWLRVLNPECESQYVQLLFDVRGAEAYYRSHVTPDPADDRPEGGVGIEALDARTLRVTLERPCAYFLDLVSFPTLYPVHPPTIRAWAYRDGHVLRRTQHLWTRPEHVVCNGPFILTRWEFKNRLHLERNPLYWDAASIRLNSIEGRIAGDTNAAMLAYETGAIDLVTPVERAVAQRLIDAVAAGQRSDFYVGDRFGVTFYRFNCKRPPFDNPDLRKALSLAIDREALCEHALRLGETPAYTYVPRSAIPLMPRQTPDGGTIYYTPPAGLGEGLSHDERVRLAREYLARSGFDRIADQRPVEISFSNDTEQRLVSEAIQQMWERDLRIRVELRQLESKVISTAIRELDYDVARANWFGDYMDPTTFLDMFLTDSGQNRTGWSCPRYDALMAAAAYERDDARRFELLRDAEKVLTVDELPVIPVFFRRGNALCSPRIEGYHDNVRDLVLMHRLRIRAER